MTILVMQDKLGITDGYAETWGSMIAGAGFMATPVLRHSAWITFGNRMQLVIKRGNRKTLGFNPDENVQGTLKRWFQQKVDESGANGVIVMDAALLGLFEPRWNISTIDYLRGGIYPWKRSDGVVIPVLVTVPVSAIHNQKKTKDIRAMNNGAENKDEWEERQGGDANDSLDPDDTDSEPEIEDYYFEPYTIPYGRWVLAADLRKFARVVARGYSIRRAKVRIVQSRADAKEALEFLLRCVLIANDIETIPEMRLMTVNGYSGLTDSGETRTYVFPMYRDFAPSSGTPVDLEYYLLVMRKINASGIRFTLHNGAYDLFYHLMYHMPVTNYALDSMTMFWAIFPELPKRLDFVSSIMLDDYVYWKGDRKSDDHTTYLEYNGKDCDRTLLNTVRLTSLLSRDSAARRNFSDAHLRVLLALGMSVRGVRVDEDRIAYHKVNLEADAAKALARVKHLVADDDFNPNSPPQKKRLLYELLGVRPRNARGRYVTKLEDASTGAVVLRAMRSEHPVFRRIAQSIMDAGEPAKQISNVINIKRSKHGRIYTGYNAVGTTTSRFSSYEPPHTLGGNLQNIRAKYRDFMVADSGCFLLDMDLSAGDDVFVTYESADPKKIALHRTGRDSHSENATLFFPDWSYDDIIAGKKGNEDRIVHPITGIRQITKKLSHGCNYLMAALTLLMTAGREAIVAAAKEVGYEDAGLWDQNRLAWFCESREMLYRRHYTRFMREGPDSWYTDLKKEFWETGGFMTPFNYFQRFLGDANDNAVHRALAATAGQAGTAGRINMAVTEMVHGIVIPTFRDAENPHRFDAPIQLSEESHGISLRLQTHDSLTWNVNPEHPHWQEGVEMIQTVMSRPVIIKNKLTGGFESFVVGTESGVGAAWGKNMIEIKGNLTGDKIIKALTNADGTMNLSRIPPTHEHINLLGLR